MDASTPTDLGGRVVAVEGLLGQLLKRPSPSKPGGSREMTMRVTALQTDGIPIKFTRYRPSDITGKRPVWYEFVNNAGDIDNIPIGIPMGPRHFSIPKGE